MLGIVGWKLYAAIGLGGMILCVGIYQAGGNAERKRGEAAQLRVELETIRLDDRLKEQAGKSAAGKAAALAAEVKQREEELDALRKALAARPEADRCPAAPADLDLLYQRQP